MTRRVDRHPASTAVTIQSSHGDRASARLRDISIYGCNVISDAAWLRAGIFLSISSSENDPIQAIVRWSRDGSCGAEFLRPIPDVIAQALSDRWG